jgi:hypothetical protein
VFSGEPPGLSKIIQEKKQEKQTILYIVDGKPMSAKEADKIDTSKIDKMEFVKEPEKIRKYTDKDVDMVVLVTMKKSIEKDTTSVEKKELKLESQ